MCDGTGDGDRDWQRPLTMLTLAYIAFHHVGTLLAPLGNVGLTRWADWVDLLTPYAVVGLAALSLRALGGTPSRWAVFVFAALAYTQGHAIHLAANSVGNLDRSDVAHFWDEYVGHYLWYLGLALLVAVLTVALAEHEMPRHAVLGHGLAALAGLTHFTNSIEGHFAWPGFAIAGAFLTWTLRERAGAARLVRTAYGLSLALFVIFGLWQRGFPELSGLDWT